MNESSLALVASGQLPVIKMSGQQQIIMLEQAKNRLAVIYRLDELKQLRDKFKASLAWLKEQKDISDEAMHYAEELCTRSEIRIGQLLLEIEKERGKESAMEEAEANGITLGRAQGWMMAARRIGRNLEGAIKTVSTEGRVNTSAVKRVAERGSGKDYSGYTYNVADAPSDEWYTPDHILSLVHLVLGDIDIDPCSSEKAQSRVMAKEFCDKIGNGLEREWHGNVWMAPPYSRNLIHRFCSKLVLSFNNGNVAQALALVSTYSETDWYQQMVMNASGICLLKGRVNFHNGNPKELISPSWGQSIFYFGTNTKKFIQYFGSSGVIVIPQRRAQ